MEIKAKIDKPYTEEQKLNFIVTQNHQNGYEIKETKIALEAWGYTQEEIDEQEKAHIQALYMTRSDFFDGTIRAFGADEDVLLQAIMTVLSPMPIEEVEKKVALNNYKNALNFYRKHPLFTMLSGVPIPVSEELTIQITSTQWDNFFIKTSEKDPDAYKELLPPEPTPEPEPEE